MENNIKAKTIVFGNNIDTDVILPGRYLVLVNPHELAKHALESLDTDFVQKAKDGIILIGGKNFGCGSSREQAPIALKYAGVKCVIAESFARIFYRNSINIGLPVIECKDISTTTKTNDTISVDLTTGKIQNQTNNQTLQGTILPPFIMQILSDGGLIENLHKKILQMNKP
jgi:3-isopropylmalate/(R)-2-methylmalate dehydratase small subunit